MKKLREYLGIILFVIAIIFTLVLIAKNVEKINNNLEKCGQNYCIEK